MPHAFAEITFTPSVRQEQERLGSGEASARLLSPEHQGGASLGPREAAFLAARDGFFQATVSQTGWPYVQFRGGAPGFLKIIDERTIGYPDYRGNRQYVSLGNMRHDDRVSIIAVDHVRRERLKLLGRVEITEDPEIVEFLRGCGGPHADRAVAVRVVAFDWNCPRHIPVRFTDAERGGEIARLRDRVADLERKLAGWTASRDEAIA